VDELFLITILLWRFQRTRMGYSSTRRMYPNVMYTKRPVFFVMFTRLVLLWHVGTKTIYGGVIRYKLLSFILNVGTNSLID